MLQSDKKDITKILQNGGIDDGLIATILCSVKYCENILIERPPLENIDFIKKVGTMVAGILSEQD